MTLVYLLHKSAASTAIINCCEPCAMTAAVQAYQSHWQSDLQLSPAASAETFLSVLIPSFQNLQSRESENASLRLVSMFPVFSAKQLCNSFFWLGIPALSVSLQHRQPTVRRRQQRLDRLQKCQKHVLKCFAQALSLCLFNPDFAMTKES